MRTVWLLLMLVYGVACGTPASDPPPDAATNSDTDAAHASDSSMDGGSCREGPGELFDRRIAPLVSQDRPSSCSKCHATGVDLGAFVRGDPCSSMACLVDQDLVSLEDPESSKLLEFIDRGRSPAPNTGVTDEMVQAEYEGFLLWIEWSARCMQTACGKSASMCSGTPDLPLRDAGAEMEDYQPLPMNLQNYPCDDDAQARAFLDHVFPSKSRCGHCHAVDGEIAGVAGAPTWIAADRTVEGARETITNLYALDAVDFDNPRKSRVLLKPLREEAGGIEHGGGGKFTDRSDELHEAFLSWILMQRQCYPALPDPGEYDEDSKL